MTTTLTEVAQLLGLALEDARTWARELEALEPVARDGRDARRLSEAQVARVAAARALKLTKGCSRREALERVRRAERADETVRRLELMTEALGLPALEARLARLEAAVNLGGEER